MSEWRSFADKVEPAPDTWVLVYSPHKAPQMWTMGFDHDNSWDWCLSRGITHWMPLPEAPKTESAKNFTATGYWKLADGRPVVTVCLDKNYHRSTMLVELNSTGVYIDGRPV